MTKQQHEPTTNDTTVAVTENNCDVEQTKRCISDLYKNATMAQNCIKTLLPYVKKQEMTKALHKQVEQYDHYIEQIGTVGQKLNFDPTPCSKCFVTMANWGIKSKMIADKSTTHVAKIMLQGTLNGIVDLYRLLSEYDCLHPEVAALAKQLLRYEEGCFESFKQML